MPAEASAEMAASAKIAATAKMAATAQAVTTTSEMATPGSVSTATAPAAGMLRPGESRRSCYRQAQQQGAGGSHYISHARVGHNSSPLCSATTPLLRAPAGLSIRRLAAIAVQARSH
jgi:hypothetical protein